MYKVINRTPKPQPYCPDPRCGARMVLRRPKPGDKWAPFWGCMRFPDCHGTRDIGEDGNLVYPEER